MRVLKSLKDGGEPARQHDRTTTRTSMVYHRLRDDLLNGRLEPGLRLRVKALSEIYDVGNSPLREALNRLAASGLIDQVDGKGFHVSVTSAGELRELITTRCWLEEIALRQSIRDGDDEWEERVVLACHRLSRLPRSTGEQPFRSSPDWDDRHRDFHTALISACSSGILIEYCVQLHERMLRYRSLAAATASKTRNQEDEHVRIRDAVLNRDSDRAVELLCSHYQLTGKIVAGAGLPHNGAQDLKSSRRPHDAVNGVP